VGVLASAGRQEVWKRGIKSKTSRKEEGVREEGGKPFNSGDNDREGPEESDIPV